MIRKHELSNTTLNGRIGMEACVPEASIINATLPYKKTYKTKIYLPLASNKIGQATL